MLSVEYALRKSPVMMTGRIEFCVPGFIASVNISQTIFMMCLITLNMIFIGSAMDAMIMQVASS